MINSQYRYMIKLLSRMSGTPRTATVLASELEVSKSYVTDLMNRLKLIGVVAAQRNKGFYLLNPTNTTAWDAYLAIHGEPGEPDELCRQIVMAVKMGLERIIL